ncbi:MAG: hypothetical protein HKN62_17695 [Phycisphaerales bacterium]|nr:hypothetical protein [Phycisphaerales bacterium]
MNNVTLSALVIAASVVDLHAADNLQPLDANPGTERTALIGVLHSFDGSMRAGTTNESVLLDAEARGAGRCIVITEPSFLVDGVFDLDRLASHLDRVAPQDYDGYVMLDWESDNILNRLTDDADTIEYTTAVSALTNAILEARTLRPNAKWGYYSVPYVQYTFADASGDWIRWHEAPLHHRQHQMMLSTQATELLEAVDYYAPSIYDMWHSEDSPEIDTIGQQVFVREVVDHCVKHSRQIPVFPVVWHRVLSTSWHEDRGITLGNRNKLFGVPEWIEDQVAPALDVGADGIVWWGADLKMINNGYHLLIPWVSDELPYSGMTPLDMILARWMHVDYAEAMLRAVDP